MLVRRLIAATALAQLVMLPAAAGDCWVKTDENALTGHDLAITAKRVAPMRARLMKLEQAQRADAATNAIPDVRYRIQRYIDKSIHPGAPMAAESSVLMYTKVAWKGACDLHPFADRVHFASLQVKLNSLGALLPNLSGKHEDDDLVWFPVPELTGQIGGFPVYENRVLVMSAGGVAPFADLTLGEYLDDWHRKLQRERAGRDEAAAEVGAQSKEWQEYIRKIEKTDPEAAAEMRRNLAGSASPNQRVDEINNGEWEVLQRWRAGLSSAQRSQRVYINPEVLQKYPFGYATTPDHGGHKLVKVNPALWKGARSESDVRTVVLQVFVSGEPSPNQEAVKRLLESVNLQPYQALLQK